MAIDFTLTNLDGTAVTLSDHLGQPIVINFWASWCGPCRIEMPELQTLHDQYAADGLVILAINQVETADVAAGFFIDEMGLTFSNPLLDSKTTVADEYGVRNLPTTLFIDTNGQVTAVHRDPAMLSQFEPGSVLVQRQIDMCQGYALSRGWQVVAKLAEDERGGGLKLSST